MKHKLWNIILGLFILSFAVVACSGGTGQMEDIGGQPVPEDDPMGPSINPAPADDNGITQPGNTDTGDADDDEGGSSPGTELDPADNPAADPADEDAENYTIGAADADPVEPAAETTAGSIATLPVNLSSRPTSRWGNFLESLRTPVGGSPADAVSTPVAPSGLTATAVSSTQINLTWQDISNNETSFQIQRSRLATLGFTTIATVTGNATGYSDTSLTAETSYFYRVRATNSAGNSGYSGTASTTTLASDGAVEKTVYASVDNMMMYSSTDFTVANTVYDSGEIGVGCNWDDSSFIDLEGNYIPNFQWVCVFSAIDFNSNISDIDGKRINSAILKLYPRTLPADDNAKIVVSTITDEWAATITWNDLDGLTVYAYYSEVVDLPVSAAPLEIDVTETVQAWADGTMLIYGFLLHQRGQDNENPWETAYRVATFHSLEQYDNAFHRPQLVLDYE